MNHERSKRLPKIIITQLAVVIIMISVALVILCYAEGYRFNIKNFKFIKTGVVYVSSYPKGADVYIDGKLQINKTPYNNNLLPGFYSVTIKKEGYHDWSNSFKVEEGLVNSYKSVSMFLSDTRKEILDDPGKINLINSPIENLVDKSSNGLYVANDYEIWEGKTLITRFSSPVFSAIWYLNKSHIVFQQSNEIRVIDIDGTNNILLATLVSDTPTRYSIGANGTELYYNDDGKFYLVKIR